MKNSSKMRIDKSAKKPQMLQNLPPKLSIQAQKFGFLMKNFIERSYSMM